MFEKPSSKNPEDLDKVVEIYTWLSTWLKHLPWYLQYNNKSFQKQIINIQDWKCKCIFYQFSINMNCVSLFLFFLEIELHMNEMYFERKNVMSETGLHDGHTKKGNSIKCIMYIISTFEHVRIFFKLKPNLL